MNNRQIKFRAWDGTQMTDKVCIAGNGYKTTWLDDQPLSVRLKSVDWPVMQFTGLRDKNGKEIYEGDVITCETTGPYPGYPHKGVVSFLNGSFCINVGKDLMSEKEEEQYTFFWCNNNFEVIGNIYENGNVINNG